MNQAIIFAPLSRQSLLGHPAFPPCRRLMIVRGRSSYSSCGASSILNPVWKEENMEIVEFDDFQVNPQCEDLMNGLALARKFKPEAILAVGGGSVMDMAKLIRFFYTHKGDIAVGPYQRINSLVPLGVIPTTAGTGSESTHFAVVYKNGIKYSIAHEDVLPDYVLIDSRLSYSASPYQIACSGFDALCQAVESYWSVKSTPESRQYAIQALKLIYEALPAAVHDKDPNAMDSCVSGSNLAGRAINISFTTAAHAYSYGLTSKAGVPHGYAVACFLPFFFQLNAHVSEHSCNDPRGCDHVRTVLKDIADCLGSSIEEAPKNLKKWILDVIRPFPHSFRLSRVEWEQVLASVNLNRLGNNPVRIDSTNAPAPADLAPLVQVGSA